MMSEEEIRKELAMGNIVCPECSDSLMNFEYDENDNCIYICPKCGYDIEADENGAKPTEAAKEAASITGFKKNEIYRELL